MEINHATDTITPTSGVLNVGASVTINASTGAISTPVPIQTNGIENADLSSAQSLSNKTSYNGLVITSNTGVVTTGEWNASTISAIYGGTGQSSYSVGDLLYAGTTTTLSKLTATGTGNALISGGLNTAPSWGKVGLTTHVSGILPETNGGTNQSTYTTGDLLQASATNTLSKLAAVATGNVLISGGVATASSWGKVGLTTHVSGILGVANGGTGVSTFGGTNSILYTTTANNISSIVTANTSALVTNNAGIPSLTSGATANRVLRTNGTSITFSQVALGTDVSGTLPIANGGTNATSIGSAGLLAFSSGTAYNFDSNLTWDNTAKSLTIGPAGTTLTNNPLSANGNVNSFLQSNVQNNSSGLSASSDMIATANTGTDTTGFVDTGINSSGFGDASFTIAGALDGYSYCAGGNYALGTDTANKDVILFTSGTLSTNERMRIKANGDVIYGIGALATSATAGYVFIPQQSGTPTGVPTTYTGRNAISLDSANNLLYFYNSKWRAIGEKLNTSTVTGTNTSITTTSTSAIGAMTVVATNMTITPPAGTYLVFYSSTVADSTNNATVSVELYAGDTVVANSVRTVAISPANSFHAVGITGYPVTVNGSQAVEIRWRVSAGTGSMAARNLTLLKIGY